MKKIILSSLIVFALLSASCQKNRTCTCTTTSSCLCDLTTKEEIAIKSTKKKAKKKCEALQSKVEEVTDGGTKIYNTVCEIE